MILSLRILSNKIHDNIDIILHGCLLSAHTFFLFIYISTYLYFCLSIYLDHVGLRKEKRSATIKPQLLYLQEPSVEIYFKMSGSGFRFIIYWSKLSIGHPLTPPFTSQWSLFMNYFYNKMLTTFSASNSYVVWFKVWK